MIKSVKKFNYKTTEIFSNLIKDFNSKAKELKSKYKIFEGDVGLILIKNIFGNFGNTLGNHIILYDYEKNNFYFYGGIDSEVSKEVIPIISELNQEFVLEVI
jgi:hypothetical protein